MLITRLLPGGGGVLVATVDGGGGAVLVAIVDSNSLPQCGRELVGPANQLRPSSRG